MTIIILLGVGLIAYLLLHDDDPHWHGSVYRDDDDE